MNVSKTVFIFFLTASLVQPSTYCMDFADDSERAHRLDDIHEDAELEEQAESNRKCASRLKKLFIAALVMGGVACGTVAIISSNNKSEPCSLSALCLPANTNLKGQCWSLFEISDCNSAALLDQGQCPELKDMLVSDLLKQFNPKVSASLCVKAEPCLQSAPCGQRLKKKLASADVKKTTKR